MTFRRISVLIVVLGLSGCVRSPDRTDPPRPATLESIPGSALHKVVLTDAAADALGLRVEPVRVVAGSLVVPTTAVIYDPRGVSWTYLATSPRTFVRHAIRIDHVTGTDAYLRSGPALGSAVVTVGAPELLGSEYGVGEE
jgi:hypothetical protein